MPVIVPLALAGIKIGVGAYQSYKANKALKNLNKQPLAQYSISPELSQAYQGVKNYQTMGYTPEETAAFGQNLAQQGNTSYQRALQQGGGGLAQAIGAGIRSNNIGALNQFASEGSRLRRQNEQWKASALMSAAGQIQGQQNLATGAAIQRRNMLESAYGNALQAGLSNIAGGVSQGANLYGASQGWGTDAYGSNLMRNKRLSAYDSANTLEGSKYSMNNIPGLRPYGSSISAETPSYDFMKKTPLIIEE